MGQDDSRSSHDASTTGGTDAAKTPSTQLYNHDAALLIALCFEGTMEGAFRALVGDGEHTEVLREPEWSNGAEMAGAASSWRAAALRWDMRRWGSSPESVEQPQAFRCSLMGLRWPATASLRRRFDHVGEQVRVRAQVARAHLDPPKVAAAAAEGGGEPL